MIYYNFFLVQARYSLIASALVSALGYKATVYLIPIIKRLTLKRGMYGAPPCPQTTATFPHPHAQFPALALAKNPRQRASLNSSRACLSNINFNGLECLDFKAPADAPCKQLPPCGPA